MRLIDADKAIGRYYAEWEKQDISDGAQDRDWLKQCIDEAPAIDAVPVVRCKDCTYFSNAKINTKGFLVCPASGMEITEDDYCSYGERKETNA